MWRSIPRGPLPPPPKSQPHREVRLLVCLQWNHPLLGRALCVGAQQGRGLAGKAPPANGGVVLLPHVSPGTASGPKPARLFPWSVCLIPLLSSRRQTGRNMAASVPTAFPGACGCDTSWVASYSSESSSGGHSTTLDVAGHRFSC